MLGSPVWTETEHRKNTSGTRGGGHDRTHARDFWRLTLLSARVPGKQFRPKTYGRILLRWLFFVAMTAVKALNPKAEVARAQAALAVNISAARGLQDVLKSNLGPKGTMKM